ncbi:MAG: hypothetical protein FWD86_04060, partial [Firmicutes bacterium]|nr:hypothetical protein [Bacillota bacterium]
QQSRFVRNGVVDWQAYSSAAQGDDLVLYTPSNRYIWVKHILLPFGDTETEALADFDRRNPRPAEGQRDAFRANLATNMDVHRNVNGERDLSVAFSSQHAVNTIYTTMRRYSNNPKAANDAFHNLIFEWNTDPGIFNNRTGYAVVFELEEGENETFMQEFADAARQFRQDRFRLGQLLTEFVYDQHGRPVFDEFGNRQEKPSLAITDFGIHIMFYGADPFRFNNAGTDAGERILTLDCFTNPSQTTTVREVLRVELTNLWQQQAYESWESGFLTRMNRDFDIHTEDKIVQTLGDRWQREIFGR